MKFVKRCAAPSLAMAALLVPAAGAWAQGYKFSPPSTEFTATGPSAMSQGGERIQCTMTETLRTNAKGKLKVIAVSFSDGEGCPEAGRLPWKVKSPTFDAADVKKVEISSSLGDCHALDFPMFLTGGSILLSWSFEDCGDAFSAELVTTPTLTLVPK
jgi:hypothetical protein